jgi:NAD(P)-dependent dehydrogenase (short-subunit alcohol dehydrogenase family)
MGRVSGKIALVTGAGSGQGAEEARLLASEGAQVVATDLNFANVERVVAEINEITPGRAVAAGHDVAKEEDWKRVCELALNTFGPVTILVNNAGMLLNISYEDTTYEQWTKTMDVNAWGTFIGIRSVVPMMKQAGVGSIINIASMAVVNSVGLLTAYTASKGAAEAITRPAAVQLAQHNIRVNAVNPGFIVTNLVLDAGMTQEMIDGAAARHPLGRNGSPRDIANLVLFLASDESDFITGTSQIIDGGRSVVGGFRSPGGN